jgi:hypothetical protein
VKVESRTDTDGNRRMKLRYVTRHPQFLLRRPERYPDEVWLRVTYPLERISRVLGTERRSPRSSNLHFREALSKPQLKRAEHRRRRSEKKVSNARRLPPLNDGRHQVGTRDSTRGYASSTTQEPGDRRAIRKIRPGTIKRLA